MNRRDVLKAGTALAIIPLATNLSDLSAKTSPTPTVPSLVKWSPIKSIEIQTEQKYYDPFEFEIGCLQTYSERPSIVRVQITICTQNDKHYVWECITSFDDFYKNRSVFYPFVPNMFELINNNRDAWCPIGFDSLSEIKVDGLIFKLSSIIFSYVDGNPESQVFLQCGIKPQNRWDMTSRRTGYPTMLTKFKTNDLITIKGVRNARGYPITGQFIEFNPDGTTAKVVVWGLYGPGTDTIVPDVDISDIETINKEKRYG